jgi:hypothetical protein
MKFDKLIQRLQEGTSPLRRLYHYTMLSKAATILSQNKFELTYSKGADSRVNPNYQRNFFMSVSTIARGRYGTGSEGKYYESNFHCVIELDASKISDNYKITPVDYWVGFPKQADETEERILARDHKIPNAKKYIIAVHIFIPPTDEIDKERNSYAMQQVNMIAHSGVEYYIYDDINDFQLLRRERAHKLEDTHQYELRNMQSRCDYWIKSDEELEKEIDWLIDPNTVLDDKLERRLHPWNWQELYSTIDCDIHNNMRDMNPIPQRALHKLSEYQRKTKKSLQDVVKDAFYRNRERY